MYFRREVRILEREGTGRGTPLNHGGGTFESIFHHGFDFDCVNIIYNSDAKKRWDSASTITVD